MKYAIPNPVPTRLALRLAELAIDPRAWIHRRVERVVYLDASTTRRFVSIDFTVPGLEDESAAEAVEFVPLALFAKEKLVNFDLRDSDGCALPMLTRSESMRLSSAVLIALGRVSLDRDFDSLAEAYVPRLVLSDESTPAVRDRALDRILRPGTEAGDRIERHLDVTTLLLDLADNFMLYLPTTGYSVGQRVIVKVAFDTPEKRFEVAGLQERIGWSPTLVGFAVPTVGYSASYHFELEAPPETEAATGWFFATSEGDVVRDRLERPAQRAHFNRSNLDKGFGRVWVGLEARSGELLGGAALFACVNLAILLFIRARLDEIVSDPKAPTQGGTEPAVAALLVIPALLVGYVVRPGEHEILSSILQLPKWAARVSALTGFFGAVLLFGGYSRGTLSDLYLGLAVIAGICAVIVSISWLGQRR